MIASFLAGCLIAGSIGVGLLFAACAVAASWPAADSRGERVSEIVLASLCVGVTLVQGLGFAGLLGVWSVATAAVGCGVAGVVTSHRVRQRVSLLATDVRAGLIELPRSLPLAAASLLGLLLACRGLALPELSWDGLTYHLTYPALWLQTGSFARFEAGGVWEQYESFPKAGEALFFLAMLPFHADHFVHWLNLLPWFGIAIAVRAAALRLVLLPRRMGDPSSANGFGLVVPAGATEPQNERAAPPYASEATLGAARRAADVCGALAVGCPALSAYVTPAYVEVPVTFALCVALAAAARALIGRDSGALAPMWLALGLAAAIKVTALAYLPLGVLVTLFAMQALAPRTCTRWVGCGLLLAAAVALPWYLHNLVACGNPLYPAGLPGAPFGPAAGTLANVWAVRESSVLSQAALGDVFEHLAKPPWQVHYPLGPGWLFLGALPVCVALSALLWLRRRAQAPAVLAALALALTLVYALSPWNGVFREANTRFLMPALIAALLSITASSSQLPAWLGRTLAGLGWVSVLVALGAARFVRDGIASGTAALAVVLCFGVVLTLVQAATAARERRLRWFAATLAMFALTCGALFQAVRVRDEDRQRAYANEVDLHPGARSTELWRFVESLPPSRIAFSAGDINATEGWFFYPLFGSRLQHSVGYVDIEAVDTAACVRRGLIRDQPDAHAWRKRLLEQGFEYLAIDGHPLELSWAQADPALFRRVFGASNSVVFAINRQVR